VDLRLDPWRRKEPGGPEPAVRYEGRVDDVPAGTLDVRLVGRPPAADRTLVVRVLSPSGEPLAGAVVSMYRHIAAAGDLLRTGTDGTVVVRDLTSEPVEVGAHSITNERLWLSDGVEGVVPEGQEVTVRLVAWIRVRVQVLDHGGRPVAHARLRREGGPGWHAWSPLTDAYGRQTLELLRSQTPATIIASVTRPDGSRWVGRASGVDASTPDVTIHIAPE
jgi:hypothetical protein